MGLISIVRSIARLVRDGANLTELLHDPGNADSNDAQVFGPSGDDSPPLADDSTFIAPHGSRKQAALGFADTRNEGVAEPGEVRRYARDPDGAIVATIWLQGDGTISISNAEGGVIEMAPGGDVTINGVTIDTEGNISTGGDIDAAGDITATGEVTAGAVPIALSTHTHTDSIGGPTTPPLP